ncbi:MAG: terminase family protein [Chitinophagales bacterium]|nr:terminase family protein [Chitinophagales bacterium]
MNYSKFGFLPYQVAYLKDKSQIKIYEKSRQVGISRTQAFEDVEDAGINALYDVWFSSNSDSNAREYIRYCKRFAETLQMVVNDLTSHDFVSDTTIYCIEFTNGKRITAVSSNPEQLHGKNGKIILDEFARRDSEFDVWEAASPAALIWGRPMRIISTHNGNKSMFKGFISRIHEGKLKWKHFKTSIHDAVAQGLADKVEGKKLTPKQRQNWLDNLRETVADEQVWQQQFCCVPAEDAASFIPYSIIELNARNTLLSLEELKKCRSLYGGIDVGRFKNLTVFWIAEQTNKNALTVRYILTLQNIDFPTQEREISKLIKQLPNLHRVCTDKTGMGIGLTDYLQKTFGTARIEGVTLTQANKEALGFRVKKLMEDNAFGLPNDNAIKEDFSSVKQSTTSGGNIRLIADTDADTGSHADYFWAAALAAEAWAIMPFVKFEVGTPSSNLQEHFKYSLKGFSKDFKS